MRLVRVEGPAGIHLARLTGDDQSGVVTPIFRQEPGPGRDPLRDAIAAGLDLASAPAVAPEAELAGGNHVLLAPVVAPQKVLAIGLNYADHAQESGSEL